MSITTELPTASEVLEVHEWTFTGRLIGALSPLATHIERVLFTAAPGQADARAWEALLASGAYERGEHFAPTVRARLGRLTDAHSGVYHNALAFCRVLVSEGSTAASAVDTVRRYGPEKLTALEVATIELALRADAEVSRA